VGDRRSELRSSDCFERLPRRIHADGLIRYPREHLLGLNTAGLEGAAGAGDRGSHHRSDTHAQSASTVAARCARRWRWLGGHELELSKMEAGRMELNLETFPLVPVIKDVAKTIEPMATKNANRVVIECPSDLGMIHADQTRFRQPLLNLASNANTFTEKGRF